MRLPSCELTLSENIGHDDLADGQSLVGKATQAGCLSADRIVAQNMVGQQIIHQLPVVLLDENDSETTIKEIAAAHALDTSVGNTLVRDQFVRHLLTGSCVSTGSLRGEGRACLAIARDFSEVSS